MNTVKPKDKRTILLNFKVNPREFKTIEANAKSSPVAKGNISKWIRSVAAKPESFKK